MAEAPQCRPNEPLPVGDAIARLIKVQYSLLSVPHGVVLSRLEQESATLTAALNALTITLGFECVLPEGSTMIEDAASHPAPTALEIIRRGAETDCCKATIATATPETKKKSRDTSKAGKL